MRSAPIATLAAHEMTDMDPSLASKPQVFFVRDWSRIDRNAQSGRGLIPNSPNSCPALADAPMPINTLSSLRTRAAA